MRISRRLAWAAAALATLGCTSDGRAPTQPSLGSPDGPSYLISDGAHGAGTPGFYFLPPVGTPSSSSGSIDPDVTPRAEVCELAAGSCTAVVASFVAGPGQGKIHGHGNFSLVWLGTGILDPAKDYRFTVYVGDVALGYVDLDVVANARDRHTVDDSQYAGVVKGSPFQIGFRIERGIAGAVVVTPPAANVAIGGTQQFTATVTDLHGNAVPGASVSWSSSDNTVATVSGSGLATGVAPGVATITAASGPAQGSALLTVAAPNHPPVANDDNYSATEATTLNVALPGVLGNDTDPDGNPLTAALVTGPAHGTVTLNADGSFSYTGAAGYSGTDSFTYQASDGSLSSAPATVTIAVGAMNHAPVANPDSYAAVEDQPLSTAAPGVLANDTDPDGNTVTAVAGTFATAHGSVTLGSDGAFVYTPAANYNGPDSFTYQVTDESLTSSAATVTFAVAPVNDAPVANADAFSAQEDVLFTAPAPGMLGNDSDVDGDALSAVAGTFASAHGGTVTVHTDGSFTYLGAANFNGTDSFTYQVTDGTATSAATVTMTVAAVNDAPTANPDSYQSIGNLTIHIPAPGVLANDVDADGDPITAVAGTYATAGGGTVTIAADGSFNYLSGAGFSGTDTFTYGVTDGSATSAPGTVTVTNVSRVWYVRNTAAAPGDGRDASPYSTLQGAQLASAVGEPIFVLYGDGSTTGLDQGIVLKAGQGLVGQGIPAPVVTVLNGQTVTLLAPGATPSITNGAPAATITLAVNDAVRGLRVLAQSGTAIAGTGFGTFSADHVSASATSGAVLDLHNGNVSAVFRSLGSTSAPGQALTLTSVGGTLEVTGDGPTSAASTMRGRTTAGASGTIDSLSGGSIAGAGLAGIAANGPVSLTLRNMVVSSNGGDGIVASGSNAVTLDNVLVTNHAASHGVHLSSVGGVTITHSNIASNATASSVAGPHIWNMRWDNVTGTALVRSSLVDGSYENVWGVNAGTGTLAITVDNVGVWGATTADGLQVNALNSAAVSLSVQGSAFTTNHGTGLFAATSTGSASSLALSVTGSSFADNTAGVSDTHGSSGTNSFDVSNNDFQRHSSVAVNVNRFLVPAFSAYGAFSGTIVGNQIGTSGVSGSGVTVGDGIDIRTSGDGGTTNVRVQGNTIRAVAGQGIAIAAREPALGHTLEARVRLNDIGEMAPAGQDAIQVGLGALNTDHVTVCLDAESNTTTANRNGLRVRSAGLPAAPTLLKLAAWDGVTPVATYLAARNPSATGAVANVNFSNATGTNVPVASCTTP
jgi:VCBS repeat